MILNYVNIVTKISYTILDYVCLSKRINNINDKLLTKKIFIRGFTKHLGINVHTLLRIIKQFIFTSEFVYNYDQFHPSDF